MGDRMSKKNNTGDDSSGLPLPSPKPETNLLIADIVLRGAGRVAREALEKRMLVSNYDPETARDLIDGRTVISTLAIYGVSKLAARSTGGLAVVASGLALKALYDRGKHRHSSGPRRTRTKT